MDDHFCLPATLKASRLAILAARAAHVGIAVADTFPLMVRGGLVSYSKETAYVTVNAQSPLSRPLR